jgi:hypothetical protein
MPFAQLSVGFTGIQCCDKVGIEGVEQAGDEHPSGRVGTASGQKCSSGGSTQPIQVKAGIVSVKAISNMDGETTP